MKLTKCFSIALLGASFVSLSSKANASGYQIQERGASGLGRAYSGEAAIADDATVLASNPAGLSLLPGVQSSVALHFLMPEVEISGTIGAGAPTGADNVGSDILIPNLYASAELEDGFTVGIGLYSMYGLNTDYPSSFLGTALADKSELITKTVNPSISYQVNDRLSVGIGIKYVDAESTLTSTQGGVQLLRLHGDDEAFSWNAGLLYQFSESTRVGLAYHHSIDLTLEGTARSQAVAAFNSRAYVEAELPPTVELSAYHELTPRLAIHGDVFWTGWSTFQEIRPIAENGAPIPDTPQNWDDAFRFSAGLTYQVNDRLKIRGGVAFDESPVPDSYRTLRIPDTDRFWLSLGLNYQVCQCFSVDLAYTHVFFDDGDIVDPSVNLQTEAEGRVNIIALQGNISF